MASSLRVALRWLTVCSHRPHGAAQALAVCFAADSISLLILDARGVALDPDTKRYAQVQSFLVGQAELSS